MSIGPDGGNGPFPAFFDAASEDGTRVILATDEVLTAAGRGRRTSTCTSATAAR